MAASAGIARTLADMTAPLKAALESPGALELLLADLGRPVTLTEDQAAAVAALLPIADALEALASASADDPPAAVLEDAIAAATAVWEAVRVLSNLSAGDLAGLPAPLDAPQTWGAIAADLPEYLLLRWLQLAAGPVYGLAHLAGIVTEGGAEGEPRARWSWTAVGDLLTDPGGHVAALYGWGGALDHVRLLDGIAGLSAAAGLRARGAPARPELAGDADVDPDARGLELSVHRGFTADRSAFFEANVLVMPVRDGGEVRGLLVTNQTLGSVAGDVDLGDGWSIELAGGADADGSLGAVLLPGGADAASAAAAPGASLRLTAAPDTPWTLGDPEGGLRLELDGVDAELSLAGTASAPELRFDAQLGTGPDGALALVFSPGEADGFLAQALGSGALTARMPASLTASSRDGIAVGGGAGFEIVIALNLTLGPITLVSARLALVAATDGATIEAALSAAFALGPFAAWVDDVGLRARISAAPDGADGTLGAVDVALELKPPAGVGFSLDLEGVVTGGGFVGFDPEIGRYFGMLSFDALTIGLAAVVVVDTELAGDPDGWAFFASLSARFPGVPLGFGFVLTGVGGLVALNRALDGEALALGLRDGAADAIMFPDDPERDAPLLFAQLDEYFPQAEGNTVFGPIVEVGWGTPTLITAQLGVLISVPQGVITVLGSISALLPVPEAPVLELQMDALGVVDVPGGTVLVTASLYDSRLLGVIELSGDVALYVSVLADPYFVLSVGGFHPGFEPPSHVPAVLESLREMRADVDVGEGVSAAITAYFAVTSNSVQFGGGFELEASAEFLSVTYMARGWFEFDVLLQFDPFLLIADVSAGVGVYAGAKELMGVELSAHLEGPEPWFATASGRFRFFFVNVRFEVTVGSHAAPAIPGTADVLARMAAELAHPEAWSARHPATLPAGLLLHSETSDALIRPDDTVVAVQTVAPLGEPLARLGELTPIQDEVDVASTALLDGATGTALPQTASDDVLGWFAPAQYRSMRDEERLSSPSYEQHRAGVAFGGGGVSVPDGDAVAAAPGHETEVWEPATGAVHALDVVTVERSADVVLAMSATARAVTGRRGAAVEMERVTVVPTSYVEVMDGDAPRVVPSHAAVMAA